MDRRHPRACGAGLDALVGARKIAPVGRVIGIASRPRSHIDRRRRQIVSDVSINVGFVDILTDDAGTIDMAPRAFRPDVPFNALPELPPRTDLETPAVLKACIPARAALAELDAAIDVIPNPAILINTIPVLEARASSEIENIVTTTDRLFRYAAGEASSADPATKEAIRYRTALRRGYDHLATRPGTDVRRIPGRRG